MAKQPIQSTQFDDLSASFSDAGDDAGVTTLDADGEFINADEGRKVATVDLSEAELEKAIDRAFGPSQRRKEADDDDAERDSRPRKKRAEHQDRDGDDADDDDMSYGKKVRKRIERERKVSQRERQARIEAERERDEYRRRIEAIEGKLSERDKTAVEDEIRGYDTELEQIEADLTKASEDAEHGQIAKLTRRLHEVAIKKANAEARRGGSQDDTGNRRDDDEAGRRGDQQSGKLDPRAKDLIDANADWWDKPERIEDRKIIEAIDMGVHRDGYKIDTDEYYIEMIRRARQRGLGDLIQLPDWISEEDLEGNDDDEDDDDDDRRDRREARRRQQPRRNGGPGGLGRGGGRTGGDAELRELRQAAKGKVTLTQRDFRRMRDMRLDPDNPEHVRRWAQSKQQSAREELASRG